MLSNGGYLSITNTQRNYGENRVYGEHEGNIIKLNFSVLCDSFSLKYAHVKDVEELSVIKDPTVQFVLIDCLSIETIAPYQARVNGEQAGAHDMAPFLDKDELVYYASVPMTFAR